MEDNEPHEIENSIKNYKEKTFIPLEEGEDNVRRCWTCGKFIQGKYVSICKQCYKQ